MMFIHLFIYLFYYPCQIANMGSKKSVGKNVGFFYFSFIIFSSSP